jgi:hypothetical protein
MNPPIRSFSFLAAACGLSAAIGFYFGRLMDSPERATTAAVKAATAQPASGTESIERGPLSNGLDEAQLPEAVQALASLAVLDGDALRKAIGEVKHSVTEPQQKFALYSMLLSRWAARDGRAALAFALAEGKQPMMAGLEYRVLDVWARREPNAAWAWFQQAEAAGGEILVGGRERFLSALFRALASNDVAAACGRMRELPPKEQLPAVFGMMGATGDPRTREALLSAAAGFNFEQKPMVYADVLSEWMLSEPAAATAWLDALPAGERIDAACDAGLKMMPINPSQAADLMVRDLDDITLLSKAYRLIRIEWSALDPLAAGEWFYRQPPSAALDYAWGNVGVEFLERDADMAFAWAKGIPKKSARLPVLKNLYQQLHEKDALRAEEVLQRAGLPNEMVTKLRQSLPRK